MSPRNLLGVARKGFTAAATTALAAGTLVLSAAPASAAGVSVTVSANQSFAALTATDVTFGFTTSATEYAIGNAITVSVSPTLPAALANCTVPTTDADGAGGADGAFGSFTTSSATYTFSAVTTAASSTGVDLCLRFPATTTAGIYSIAITDNNDSDAGAVLVYVGDENDVLVTALVAPTLSFVIRNAADTQDKGNVGGGTVGPNLCDLGNLSPAGIGASEGVNGYCSYRLKVSTNATAGWTTSFIADAQLNQGGGADINAVADGDVTAGQEEYGFQLTEGSATVGTISRGGTFPTAGNDYAVPTSNTTLYSSNGPSNPGATDLTNTALMEHRADIDSGSAAGAYDQLITYTVTAAF